MKATGRSKNPRRQVLVRRPAGPAKAVGSKVDVALITAPNQEVNNRCDATFLSLAGGVSVTEIQPRHYRCENCKIGDKVRFNVLI